MPRYDLLLKGGRVIDPAENLDEVRDVAFAGGKVAATAPDIPAAEAATVRDVGGRIVTPGLVDLHTHVYWGGTAIGVDAEEVARRSGTTTFLDVGTAGAGNFTGFKHHVIDRSAVRILALLNISFPGIYAFSRAVMVGETQDIRLLDARECVRVAREFPDHVLGVKVRVGRGTSGTAGLGPLHLAMEAADALGLPLMTHLDMPPPSVAEVLSLMRPGDILTHCFRPFPNAPVHGDGRVRDEVMRARERGVVFDIGHGSGSFGFATARQMLEHGFKPDVISSDVHVLNIDDGPAYDLLHTMSKFLCLGMSLGDVVRAATTTPAKVMVRPDLGTLMAGSPGDAAVLELRDGKFDYDDVIGERITGDQRLFAGMVVIGGELWHDAAL